MVAAEPITDVDTTAADMLVDLDAELDAPGSALVFAELKDPVRRKIERYELTDAIESRHFFATMNEAAEAYRDLSGAVVDPGPEPVRTSPARRWRRMSGRSRLASRSAQVAPPVTGTATSLPP